MNKPIAGKEFEFEMVCDLYGLIETQGMGDMNDWMDDEFQRKYPEERMILTDITYEPVRLNEDKNIIVLVHGIVDEF